MIWRGHSTNRDYLARACFTGVEEAALVAAIAEGAASASVAAEGVAAGATLGSIGTAVSTALPYISAASGLVGAAGSFIAGQNQSDLAEYNAKVAENEAERTRQATEFEVAQQRRRATLAGSSNAASIAGSGLSSEGSPLLVSAYSQELADLDEQAIRYSGSVAEARSRSAAAAQRLAGSGYQTAGYFGAGANLLTGAINYGKATRGVGMT